MIECELIYKCRRCNKICKSERIAGSVTMIVNSVISSVNMASLDVLPEIMITHLCDDNNIGVCDLIGGERV